MRKQQEIIEQHGDLQEVVDDARRNAEGYEESGNMRLANIWATKHNQAENDLHRFVCENDIHYTSSYPYIQIGS